MTAIKTTIQIGTFATTILLSVSLASLSIYKLIVNEDVPLYIGMLSSIVSLYLPSPLSMKFKSSDTSFELPMKKIEIV